MFNIIKIGEKNVPMLSMASVDIYYRNIFHEDPLKIQTEEQSPSEAVAFYQRMGFVMAKFAELKSRDGMRELREDDYLEWLDGFGRLELMNALGDIQKTYDGQTITNAEAKKNTNAPSGV